MEVGSYLAFFIFLLSKHPLSPSSTFNYILVTTGFSYVGFIICYICAQSHAAIKGSIAGLGVVIALQSVTFDDFANTSPYWAAHRDAQSALCFLMAFGGYCMFLFGLFTYHRLRNDAVALFATYRR